MISCKRNNKSIIPTYNDGGYTIETNQQVDSDSIYVYGQVRTILEKQPLMSSQISFACSQYYTNENGEYSFKLAKAILNDFSLKIRAIGYKTIDTNFLPKADTLKIDVYLQIYDSPIYHCD